MACGIQNPVLVVLLQILPQTHNGTGLLVCQCEACLVSKFNQEIPKLINLIHPWHPMLIDSLQKTVTIRFVNKTQQILQTNTIL